MFYLSCADVYMCPLYKSCFFLNISYVIVYSFFFFSVVSTVETTTIQTTETTTTDITTGNKMLFIMLEDIYLGFICHIKPMVYKKLNIKCHVLQLHFILHL